MDEENEQQPAVQRPAEGKTPMMQFRLRTLMLVFVILWSSLAAFEAGGILVTCGIVIVAATIHMLSKPTVKEWLVSIAIIGVLVALLLPAVQTSCGSPTGRCINNLINLTRALLAYHDQHGSFPPAYVVDKAGKPMHSWRVQMLPFLDRPDIYETYDFDKPWNSPANAALACSCSYLHCPADPNWSRPNATFDLTSYFAVIGPQTAWRGSTPVKLSDLPDNGERMILLVESADRAIDWKEPKDLTYEEAVAGVNRHGEPCISSTHTEGGDYFHYAHRGAYAAFVDGSVRFLPEDISPDDLRALLTGDAARTIDLESLLEPRLNWSHIVGLAVLIASGALLVIGAIVQRLHRTAHPVEIHEEHEEHEGQGGGEESG
jgi:hypothetical protein